MNLDLNKLTDEEALILENKLAQRRILKAHSNCIPIIDVGHKTCDIQLLTAANHNNIQRTVFAETRQSSKNPENDFWRLCSYKPKFNFNLFDELEEIDKEHEQYLSVFNQFRRVRGLPSIELKVNNKYTLRLGKKECLDFDFYLKRIDGNIKGAPELYFSTLKDTTDKGTNISVFKILRTVSEKTE